MSMRLFFGCVFLCCWFGVQVWQVFVFGFCCLIGGQVWVLNEVVLNCLFDNGQGLFWCVVNELISGMVKGMVLFVRLVSLFLNYKFQVFQEVYELVIGGNWFGVGYLGFYGMVVFDVKGIGYWILVDVQDGVKWVILVDNQFYVLDK